MKKIGIISIGLICILTFGGCTTNDVNKISPNSETSQSSDSISTTLKISDLAKYQSVSVKIMTETDSVKNKNMQIMGTKGLDKTLGTKTLEYNVEYVYMGNKVIREASKAKWGHICPKSWNGRCKGQITYKNNAAMQAGKPGDTLVIAKKSETDITLMVMEKDNKYQKELLSFLSSDPQQKNKPNIVVKEDYDIKPANLPIDGIPQKTWARVYFTPSLDCENNIIELIDRSKKIDIAVYSITNDRIVAALVRAKKSGAKVRIITDRLQSKGRASLIPKLEQEGFIIKTNIKHKIMHHKFAIFDGKEIESGSYNWTTSASKSNAENCMFFRQNSKLFTEQFDYLWKFYQQ